MGIFGQRADRNPGAAALAAAFVVSAALASPATAQDATWNLNGTGNYNTAANWAPATVPTGTATFGVSNQNAVTITAFASVGNWLFTVGASAYTFANNASFVFTGAGIQINGGSADITNNINLQFTNASTAGSATIVSTGSLLFNDSSTAGNASITNGGSINFNATSSAGSAAITNGGAINFNASSTAGTAATTITNNGALTFNDSSSAGTATITNNTVLNFNDASSAGNAVITNNAFANTSFNGSSTAGSAAITNSNIGNLYFNNTSSAGSGTVTNDGFFQFNDASTAGSATIVNNGNLSFNNTSNAGTATITQNSSGFLTFNGTSTAGSAQITSNGIMFFRDTSTAGNATITNTGGNVEFRDTSTAGSATIITNSGGAIVFRNTASGGTARVVIDNTSDLNLAFLTSAGTTFGSIEGNGNFRLLGKSLTTGSNNLSTNVGGVISGNGGSLTKVGTGTLTLSGVNTYTGATTVSGGTLAVNGSTASSSLTTVNAGGTLGGTGTVGNATIAGGTLAPGNSIGALTIQGNLVLTSAVSYMVEVSGTTSDKTVVTGTATIAGNVSVKPLTRVAATTTYTILTSTGTTGTFAGVTLTNTTLARNARLSYVGNDVLLTLDPGTLSPGLPGNANANQRAIANGIDTALIAGANLPGGFNALFNLSGAPLLTALTQASGETAVGSQQTTFNAVTQFMGTLLDPFLSGRSDPANANTSASQFATDDDEATAYARRVTSASSKGPFARVFTKAPPRNDLYDPRWSIWAAGFGGSQTTDGVAAAGSNTATSSIYGVAAGADYRFSPNTIAGFALAGGGTNFRVNNLGTGRSDLFQAGAFVRHTIGAAYVAGAVAYGWQDVTTDRTLTIAGVDRLRARFDSNTLSARVEGGYRLIAGGVGLTPYAAGQVTTIFLPNYTEQVLAGANTFALAYASRDVTATRSELGLRTDKSYALETAILTLRGRAAWAHNFNPDRSVNATFQTLPGASFVVNGAQQTRDAALTTASAELKWANNWSIAGTFEGEFSDRSRSYAGKGVVRCVW